VTTSDKDEYPLLLRILNDQSLYLIRVLTHLSYLLPLPLQYNPSTQARSAISFDLPNTDGLNDASLPGSPAYGVQVTNGGLFTVAGGGIITLEGLSSDPLQALGAIAVEGPGLDPDTATRIVSYASVKLQAMGNKITLRYSKITTDHPLPISTKTNNSNNKIKPTNTTAAALLLGLSRRISYSMITVS